MTCQKQFWHKQFFYIQADPFKVDVLISINATKPEVLSFLKKTADPQKFKEFNHELLDNFHDSINEGRMISFSGGYIVLLKANKKDFRDTLSTLIHELTHVSHYILRDRRIPLSEDTEEVYCYLLQNLSIQALRAMY